MNPAKFIEKWARITPDRPAVALGCKVLYSYQALSHRAAHLAAGLLGLGLGRGDRVAILLKNVPAYFECLLACWHIGMVPVSINAKLHLKEITYILEHCGA